MASFLSVLLQVSAGSGALILLLLALRRLLRRFYPARWFCWVWLALTLRLLLPFAPTFAAPPVQLPAPPALQSGLVTAAPPSLAPLPPSEAGGNELLTPEPEPEPAPVAPGGTAMPSPAALAAGLWLAGALGYGAYQAGRALLFRRRVLRWALPPRQQATGLAFGRVAAQLGLAKRPRLLISERVAAPLLLGLTKPVLLLPGETFAPDDLALILKHELTHYKRHDLWFKLALLAAAAMHWFNPLVHLLVRQASADAEQACDDAVLQNATPGQRQMYGEVILCAISGKSGRAPALTTCFGGGKRQLKERFANILSTAARRRGLVALALVALAALCAAGLLGWQQVKAEPTGQTDPLPSDMPAGWQRVEADFAPYQNSRTTFVYSDAETGPRTIQCEILEGPMGWIEEEEAVKATLLLPQGWQLRPAQNGEAALNANTTAPFNLYDETGALVGTLGYGTYFEEQFNGNEFYGAGYKARYYWIMTGFYNWNNAYTRVLTQNGRENALCRVSYTKEVSLTGSPMQNDGLLAYDDALLRYVSLELTDGALNAQQLRTMAESLTLLKAPLPPKTYPSPAPAVVPDGFTRQSITFPAYEGWMSPYNGEIYNAAPFTLTLVLPQGWELRPPADPTKVSIDTLFGPMEVWNDTGCIGFVGYDLYEPVPSEERNDNPRQVYASIMLGNHYNWDFDYTVVSQTSTGSSATCLAGWDARSFTQPEDGWELIDDFWFQKGALCHDDTLGVFVGIRLFYDQVTDEQLAQIAQSMLLARAAG